MNMRRPYPGRIFWIDRICAGLDRLEAVAPFGVCRLCSVALKIWIERRGQILIRWMRVATKRIGLPNFDSGSGHRLTLGIQDSPSQMDDLALRAFLPARNERQVCILIKRLHHGVERAQDFIGCAPAPHFLSEQ